MNQQTIQENIYKIVNENDIYKLDIQIGPYNEQIDRLKIVFKPEITPDLKVIGAIMEYINQYTIDDEYGDLTEAIIKYSTFEDVPNNAFAISIEITFNIDS